MIEKKNRQWEWGGRPTKLTNDFLEAAESVLNQDINAIIFTDDELRIAINEELSKDAQISNTTFENWKAWKLEDSINYQKFLVLYKKALNLQKNMLFKSMKDDSNWWQRFAWIIERKFSDWNLKQITENTNKNTNTNINYESSDSEEFKDILKDNWLI